jgi:hypothetical protein
LELVDLVEVELCVESGLHRRDRDQPHEG